MSTQTLESATFRFLFPLPVQNVSKIPRVSRASATTKAMEVEIQSFTRAVNWVSMVPWVYTKRPTPPTDCRRGAGVRVLRAGIGDLYRGLCFDAFSGIQGSLNDRYRRFGYLQLARMVDVTGHFWIDVFEAKQLVIRQFYQGFQLLQTQSDGDFLCCDCHTSSVADRDNLRCERSGRVQRAPPAAEGAEAGFFRYLSYQAR